VCLDGGDAGGVGVCCDAGPGGQYARCLLGIGAELGLGASIFGECGGVRDVLHTGWWMMSVDILCFSLSGNEVCPQASVDLAVPVPSSSDSQAHALD